MRPLLWLAVTLLASASPVAYQAEQESWRADYERRLKAPDGWLAVAGLYWLHDGANKMGSDPFSDVVLPGRLPKFAGTLLLDKGKVVFDRVSPPSKHELKPDTSGHPDVVQLGDATFTIIERGGKTGLRLRDPEAETRRKFTGCTWYPPAEAWKVKAKWVAYAKPRTIRITNILGMTDEEPSPGYAEFTVKGKTLRLEPVTEDNQLFFMFKDGTSGKGTYGAGRFVYAAMPKGDSVEIDFNHAHNPPCAFTAFATCPLPPKQNTLAVSVEAGEKNYGHHQ